MREFAELIVVVTAIASLACGIVGFVVIVGETHLWPQIGLKALIRGKRVARLRRALRRPETIEIGRTVADGNILYRFDSEAACTFVLSPAASGELAGLFLARSFVPMLGRITFAPGRDAEIEAYMTIGRSLALFGTAIFVLCFALAFAAEGSIVFAAASVAVFLAGARWIGPMYGNRRSFDLALESVVLRFSASQPARKTP